MINSICKSTNIRGYQLKLFDIDSSKTVEILNYEFNKFDEYKLADSINFKKNDVILDIGANVGTTSIYLAKKFPMTKIYSFEPVFYTWKNLKRNLHINSVENIVKCRNLAVSGQNNSFLTLRIDPYNSGASSSINQLNQNKTTIKKFNVKTISLDNIFEKFGIQKVKLLKIDCEGAEFDILYNSKQLQAGNIEYIVGETHSFDKKKNNRESLLEYLEKYVDKEKMSWVGW